MAATTTRAKASNSKTASKKSASSSRGTSGPKLEVRYPKVMKPQRVYPLVVSLPSKGKKKRDDEEEVERGSVVVVRPVIAGAQVVPAEQRLAVAPGNQITFQVTPLARGRLPRAHLEIYAPGQAPEDIPLVMKVKTQRLALVLLLLAWLIPTFMISITQGSLQPKGASLDEHFKTPMLKDLPAIPVFNRKVDSMPEGWKDFTIADNLGDYVIIGYSALDEAVDRYRWLPNAVGAGFVFLALLALFMNRSRRKRLVRSLDLDLARPAEEETATTMLEPI